MFCGSGQPIAATHLAASCERADVVDRIDAASPGDTICVPGGSATWDTGVQITKSLRFIGQGRDALTITAGATIGNGPLLNVALESSEWAEISGFTFDVANCASVGIILNNVTSGTALWNMRFHHCRIKNAPYRGIMTHGKMFGLIDYCDFVDNEYDFKCYGNSTANDWTEYPGLANIGTINYVYIENCTSSGMDTKLVSSGESARWVYRHNTADITGGGSAFNVHGDTSNFGVVAAEMYHNTIYTTEDPVVGGGGTSDIAGGTVIMFYNDMWGGTSGTRVGVSIEEESGTGGAGQTCPANETYPESLSINNSYFWKNINTNDGNETVGGGELFTGTDYDPHDCILENQDYFDDFADGGAQGFEDPLNFTYGVIAARPAEPCTENWCYWAEDVGDQAAGAQGVLYRCMGDSAWDEIYQPFTFPHPLSLDPDFNTDYVTATGDIVGVSID